MIIDATKINYFSDAESSVYGDKKKSRRVSKAKEEVGVIVDASTSRKTKQK